MLLKKLILDVEVIKEVGDLNLDITNIHSDSRKIKERSFFGVSCFERKSFEKSCL